MNLEKNNTLFCDKIERLEMNELLGEIFRKLSVFNINKGYCPDNILLRYEDYLRIKKERPNVISIKDDKEYILCMCIYKINKNINDKKPRFINKINSLFNKKNRGSYI